jgi:hypothetical protein
MFRVISALGLLVVAATLIAGGPKEESAARSPADQTGDTTTLSREVVEALLQLREVGAATFPEVYGDIASGPPGTRTC